MRRIALALALGGVLLTGGVALGHTVRYATSSSYGYPDSAPKAALGQIRSPQSQCTGGRAVRLFLERAGADQRVGTTRSGATGFWEVRADLRNGKRYYAKVMARNLGPSGHRHICRSYRTTALRFPSGTP
jgi:hypothetical protein